MVTYLLKIVRIIIIILSVAYLTKIKETFKADEEELKDSDFELSMSLADRKNMAFTGSLVTKGRGKGLVIGNCRARRRGLADQPGNRGVDVKRPFRRGTVDPRDRVQSRNHQIPPPFEMSRPLGDEILRPVQGLDRRPLGD